MKNLTLETVRLVQAPLRRQGRATSVSCHIDAAGDDPGRQAEVLQKARAVCLSHADLLRGALKDSAARRHQVC